MSQVHAVCVFLILIFGSYSGASCFRNKSEYESIKTNLPPLLRQMPLLLGADGIFVKAAAQLNFDNENLLFFFNCNRELERPLEDFVSICVIDSKVEIRFDNNVVETVQIVGTDKVKLRDMLTLKTIGPEKYSDLARQLANNGSSTDKNKQLNNRITK